MLSTNGLWWRYSTSNLNFNRGRAGTLSKLLLCQDYLARPISLGGGGTLLDVEGNENAVRENPVCQSCHATLDPLASALFGYWWIDIYDGAELARYHPERELLGEELLGVAPGYFGQPISGLNELGAAVAADPRFGRCATETAAAALWRRPVALSDFAQIDVLLQAYSDADGRLKPVLRAITDTDTYRAGDWADTDDTDTRDREIVVRPISPSVLGTALEDLTGFRWTSQGFDLLGNDERGYRIMAGGVDGVKVTAAQTTPSTSWSLVSARLAQAAAWHVAQRDLVDAPDSPLLLAGVTLGDRPGDEAFDRTLPALVWRLHAVRPSAEELAALATLWTTLDDLDGPQAAWAGVLIALFHDPLFLTT